MHLCVYRDMNINIQQNMYKLREKASIIMAHKLLRIYFKKKQF